MILINIENVSKSYTEKKLLEDISLPIMEGDKIGLIGINGTGKSTLLKLIAGLEKPDSGKIIRSNNINFEYLPQNIDFVAGTKVIEQIFKGDSRNMRILREYESAINNPLSPEELIISLAQEMDEINGWDLESEAKTILTKLAINEFDERIEKLSGGQRKRVALASALINPSDLLILDEPTNHLDDESIKWLENYLANRKGSILMITHDRYFLDRVVNKIFELDMGQIYIHKGNYSYFLEKKVEREEMEFASEQKRKSLYKKELAWMKQGAKARTTKQKARIQRFKLLEAREPSLEKEELDISVASSRLGRKIIEIKNISKKYGDREIIKDFTYTLLRDDRVGILGPNGIGKSTLFKIISGEIKADKGSVELGETVRLGVFSQETSELDYKQKAIEYIKEGGEFIARADGRKVSASQMMEDFLFPADLQWMPIGKFSGGEKRRLQLLRVLIESPNVLLLDEPTNDLDIQTLTILEEYIEEFKGAVIIISHDRYLLDKTVEKVFVFEGQGLIKEYTGNYSYFEENRETEKKHNYKPIVREKKKLEEKLTRLSYNEQREWERIDGDIVNLEEEIEIKNKEIDLVSSDYIKLELLLKEKEDLEILLEEKMERWIYLSDKLREIEANLQVTNSSKNK